MPSLTVYTLAVESISDILDCFENGNIVNQAKFDEQYRVFELMKSLLFNFDELQEMVLVVIIWMFIVRFKKVDVQVVRDEQVTTLGIISKMKFLNTLNSVIITILVVLLLSLGIYLTLFE